MDSKPSKSPGREGEDQLPSWDSPKGSDLPEWPSDAWADPHEERALLRRRIWRFRLGFSVLGLSMVVLSLVTLGHVISIFDKNQFIPINKLDVPHWRLIEGVLITWGSLLGVCLLWGRWPDVNWQRRSGILLLMCIADAVLWTLDHAVELGLRDAEFEHGWFRYSLAAAMGWSEFALMATLAADLATHLGEPQSAELARAARSLATTGAMIWFMFFYFATNWQTPIWPLRHRAIHPGTQLLYLGWIVLLAINLVQVTGLCLLAGRCCGRALREMAQADRADDLLPSRSEAGWEELNRRSGPDDRG